MSIFFTLTAIFGLLLFGWGTVDATNALDASGEGARFPSAVFAYTAAAKISFGILILLLSVGFEALLSMGREIIRRHPGLGAKPTLLERLLPPEVRDEPLPGAAERLREWE